MSGDYISRETALTIIGRLRDKCGNDEMAFALNWASRLLRDAPAADVVEVVRCAECKYDEHCMLQEFVRDERIEPYDKTVFFCADGERKDGGQENG